jgi:hypothetical protein
MNTKQTERFLKTIWAGADHGHLTIFTLPGARSYFINMSEPDAVGQTLQRISSEKGKDIYYCIGILGSVPEKGHRGSEQDVIGIPGFWMDIDIQGGAHAKQDLPSSVDAAMAFLDELPLKPSLVVSSGYGLHVYPMSQ